MIKHHGQLFMQTALSLAEAVKGTTFPNPAVGAVIVDGDIIVGQGATNPWGGLHAEKAAIALAAEKTRGATLYVTLEPCCHHGKKTPPCTDAIIAAGIAEVYVAIEDPNPMVAGKGIEQLRNAGIKVYLGLMRDEATLLNEDFIKSIISRKAWVTLKLAQTLDGRISDTDGDSRWITGVDSREFVHELRRRHAAVAVGIGTLRADNPQLNVRHKAGYNPARIIFALDENIPQSTNFVQNATETRSIVVVRNGQAGEIKKSDNGIEYWYTGDQCYLNALQVFLEMAYNQHVVSVFIEGGQRVASEFLNAGLVDRVYLFYGNRVLGGGRDGLRFDTPLSMKNGIFLNEIQFKTFKEDFLVTGKPVYSHINAEK
ncbi:MAG TPA: bifunctional diaminohydroxyphosphoribosylaminopyrimidine deaminase/5-amino-6-(5-phosphoribosylamino)uracil reductase RibD [Chitinispirillaceae bacterium]|nr:bifunctional diaminohydroxyphosphoribosylaminopyrimidine deaminase/5-amino-6-(5-phosphoribosylamino)uracil reductase RibD [Chitinispirillaceae bacterium]